MYGNKMTKNEIIEKVQEENKKGRIGFYINTDGIISDLDGKGTSDYLRTLGFKIIKYYDTGKNGIVLTEDGIKVSTNGFCSIYKIED
jgi:hypothetical protein